MLYVTLSGSKICHLIKSDNRNNPDGNSGTQCGYNDSDRDFHFFYDKPVGARVCVRCTKIYKELNPEQAIMDDMLKDKEKSSPVVSDNSITLNFSRNESFDTVKKALGDHLADVLSQMNDVKIVDVVPHMTGPRGGISYQVQVIVTLGEHLIPAVVNIYSDMVIDNAVFKNLQEKEEDKRRNETLKKFLS